MVFGLYFGNYFKNMVFDKIVKIVSTNYERKMYLKINSTNFIRLSSDYDGCGRVPK